MRPFRGDRELTAAEHLDAARDMADTGRPTLARLLAEAAARQDTDNATAILDRHPDPSTQRKD
ncbi:hypothetical protein HUT19_15710 [Streptomyces sp. NA02950]|uniref:hypothetical protein n=1 Tax=Streptomyces sp. NA02950 TaxID=2742137 RepID=UPI001590FD51|nr:hypothetical protein [Streptomyces sp. NA02950]QKV93023.1 hypothetical protein HUT19_15710 [Streptomyces sp. NA02950]